MVILTTNNNNNNNPGSGGGLGGISPSDISDKDAFIVALHLMGSTHIIRD